MSFGGVIATNVTIVSAVDVTATNPDGQSGRWAQGYTCAPASSTETVLLADDFNDGSIDTNKWVANNLFSGFTDATVALNEVNGRFEVGPLKQNSSGSHYNGLRSASMFNFTGTYCYGG